MLLCAFAIIALAAHPTLADSLTLKSGKTLEGTIMEKDDEVRVVTPLATLSFTRDEIAGIQYGPSPQDVYKEHAARLADDDAKGHYELGVFARKKGMLTQAKAEFEKAVAADTGFTPARQELGQVFKDGKWLTRDEYMAAAGYVLYRGRYVTKGDAEKLEARDAAALRRNDAYLLVRGIASMISNSSGDTRRENQDRLAGMSDPAFLDAVIEQIYNRDGAVRSAAILALLNYREDAAALAALDAAFNDPEPDIRYQARVILNKKQNESAYQNALASLWDDDDSTRFRAAEILGAIGDPRAIPYLIENLSWTRVTQNVVESAPQPRWSTFGSGVDYIAGVRVKVAPGAVAYEPIRGVYQYGQRVVMPPPDEGDRWAPLPATSEEEVLNYEALSALQALTGKDFRFDKGAWRDWYLANRLRFVREPAPQQQGSGAADARGY